MPFLPHTSSLPYNAIGHDFGARWSSPLSSHMLSTPHDNAQQKDSTYIGACGFCLTVPRSMRILLDVLADSVRVILVDSVRIILADSVRVILADSVRVQRHYWSRPMNALCTVACICARKAGHRLTKFFRFGSMSVVYFGAHKIALKVQRNIALCVSLLQRAMGETNTP